MGDALKGGYRKTFVEMFKEFTCPNSPTTKPDSPKTKPHYQCAMPKHEAWHNISNKYRTIHEDIMNGNPDPAEQQNKIAAAEAAAEAAEKPSWVGIELKSVGKGNVPRTSSVKETETTCTGKPSNLC